MAVNAKHPASQRRLVLCLHCPLKSIADFFIVFGGCNWLPYGRHCDCRYDARGFGYAAEPVALAGHPGWSVVPAFGLRRSTGDSGPSAVTCLASGSEIEGADGPNLSKPLNGSCGRVKETGRPSSCDPSAASGPSPGRPTSPTLRRAWTPSLRNALRPLLHDDESQQKEKPDS